MASKENSDHLFQLYMTKQDVIDLKKAVFGSAAPAEELELRVGNIVKEITAHLEKYNFKNPK